MIDSIPPDIEEWPRRRAVLFMIAHTTDPGVIAGVIGSTSGTVQTIMSDLRGDGHDIPTRRRMSTSRAGYEIRSTLPAALAEKLNTEAAARHERPIDLARRILATVLNADLVNAVLDNDK